jgi:hypothetical protein
MTMLMTSRRWFHSLSGSLLLVFVVAAHWLLTEATAIGSGGPLFESSLRPEQAWIASGKGEEP